MLTLLLVVGVASYAQSQQPSSPTAVKSLQITEWENTDPQSVSWTFSEIQNGAKGWGSFKGSDRPQPLVLQQFDGTSIIVSRTDTVTSWGGSAVYTGTLKGNQIEGESIYWDKGHQHSAKGRWHGVITVSSAASGPGKQDPAHAQVQTSPPITPRYQSQPGTTPIPLPQSGQRAQVDTDSAFPRPPHAGFSDLGCPVQLPNTAESAFFIWNKAREIQRENNEEGTDLLAIGWYCKAAGAGSAQAALQIGQMYESGFGLPAYREGSVIRSDVMQPDYARAYFWYEKAATHGNTEAMLKVSTFNMQGPKLYYRAGTYFEVNRVEKDLANAMKWLRRSAGDDDTEAMESLAEIDRTGIDDTSHPIARNPVEAKSLLLRIAEQRLKFQALCQDAEQLAIMRQVTPERSIKMSYFGAYHQDTMNGLNGGNLTCIAVLGPTRDNSMQDELLGALRGGMMSTWTYTVYSYGKDMGLTERSSVREELLKSATEAAVVTAAAKAASQSK